MKLLSIVFLCLHQCLTEEIPDLTAIYHIGGHKSGGYAELHLRTNALGLPVRFGNELFDTKDYEFRLDTDSVQEWETNHWNIVPHQSAFFKSELISTNDIDYHQFYRRVHISVDVVKCMQEFHLLLTPSKEPLGSQLFFYYIRIQGDSCEGLTVYECSSLSIFDTSFTVDGHTVSCKIKKTINIGTEVERENLCPDEFQCLNNGCISLNWTCDVVKDCLPDGDDEIHCYRLQRHKIITYNRYKVSYSFYIRQQGSFLQLWENMGDLQQLSMSEDIQLNFFKIVSTPRSARGEVSAMVPLLQTSGSDAQLTSPPFMPQHKDMCMVIVFYTENSLEHPLRVYVVDNLSNKIQLGSVGNASKSGWQSERLITSWPDSVVSKRVRLLLEISNVNTKVVVERISSCNSEVWEDVIKIQRSSSTPFTVFEMPVVVKQNNTFLQTEDYASNEASDAVLECQHDGESIQNSCSCSPGFVGRFCEEGCGRNRFGKDCKGFCSAHSTECSGLLLCTTHASCFCAPGYKGDTCEEVCESGTYGNNCSQICGYCEEEGTCEIYSGKCSACLLGYHMPLCKEKYPYTLAAPVVSATETFGQVTVIPELNNITSKGNPSYYSIQYKKNSLFDQWKTHSSYPIPESRNAQETVITGLEYGKLYEFRTVLIDADLNSYEGEGIPTADVITSCIVPENPDYHVQINSDQSSFTASWDYIPENVYWCPAEKFEVSWLDRWEWITESTETTSLTVTNLLPSMSFKLKVRALTSKGFAPFSPVIKLSTKESGVSVPVRNLRVESADGNNVKLKWTPPLDLESEQLTYTVRYKCVKQAACQKDCANSSGELHVTEPEVSLELLYPFSQYLISVSVDDGTSSNLMVGTKIAEPVEAPEPSETPAVKTNTSLIVFWDQPDVCSGYLINYVYQLYKVNSPQVIKTGSTVNTNATFDNLQARSDYRVLVFVNTSFGRINNNRYLEINVSTSATVPDTVQNLTVYKQGRHLLGLRWAQPVNTYGMIISFTVKYGHAKDTNYKMVTIKPISCVAWPHLFCYTVTGLRADRLYTIGVSARNSEIDADGDFAEVTAITKEKTPGPPEDITLFNLTSNSIHIKWKYPWLANGVIRSFLVNIEETEQFEEDKCCQDYPLNEVTVTDELEYYEVKVYGLQAASTYVVSVSAKTIVFGPSQTITVHTRPPPLPVVHLPNIIGNNACDPLTWVPLTKNFVNNSDIYKSLIKGSLVLVASFEGENNNTGIKDKKLNEVLDSLVPPQTYYLAAEYASNETEIHLGTGEVADGKWGEIHNTPLQENITYVLLAVQITEHCGVYNTDIAHSSRFCTKCEC